MNMLAVAALFVIGGVAGWLIGSIYLAWRALSDLDDDLWDDDDPL